MHPLWGTSTVETITKWFTGVHFFPLTASDTISKVTFPKPERSLPSLPHHHAAFSIDTVHHKVRTRVGTMLLKLLKDPLPSLPFPMIAFPSLPIPGDLQRVFVDDSYEDNTPVRARKRKRQNHLDDHVDSDEDRKYIPGRPLLPPVPSLPTPLATQAGGNSNLVTPPRPLTSTTKMTTSPQQAASLTSLQSFAAVDILLSFQRDSKRVSA